jgi:L-galactose dehydrogenase
MTTHRFGRTGLQLSRVGLGAGGPSRLGTQQGNGDSQVEALIACARDLSINHIDTARGYGTEATIGRALQRLGAHDMMIATKVFWHDRDTHRSDTVQRDPQELVGEVEASLKDLRRDQIDIFQFHAVLPEDFDEIVERLLPVALSLRDQGKIRHIGITEDPSKDHSQAMARAAAQCGHFDSLMVQYSILDQVAEPLGITETTFAATRARDMGVFCMSAARSAFTGLEPLRQTMDRLADGESTLFETRIPDGMTPADLAFKFAAAQAGIDVVLVGTGNQAHLRASTAAVLGAPLSSDILDWLRQRYGMTDGQLLWQD